MSDKEPMTWGDMVFAFIAWCACIEIINGLVGGFRMFFGGRHPDDLFHLEAGGGLAVLALAMFVWMKLKERGADDQA
jgi:hypothetical protein